MKFSQFSYWRRVFVKRVASVSVVALAVSLTACSSQGISVSQDQTGSYNRKTASSTPIPSEPVYGYPDKNGRSGSYGASLKTASYADDKRGARIQRTSLAPVRTASYNNAEGRYAGSSYALQPIDAHEKSGSPRASGAGKRYAQARPRYYDGRTSDYQSSYSDYKSYRRRDDDVRKSYERRAPRRAPERSANHYDHDTDYYTVVDGDTVYGIAKRFGMSTTELAELNGIIGSKIYAGQKLRVRGTPKYTAANRYDREPDYDVTGPRGYGDSYEAEERKAPSYDYRGYDKRDGYDAAEERGGYKPPKRRAPRRQARGYQPDHDSADDRRRPAKRYRKPEGSYYTYAVERGDTLYAIARRNGLNHHELARYNDIPTSATLYPGQVLHIPKGRGYDWGRGERKNGPRDDYEERRPRRNHGEDRYSRNAPSSDKPSRSNRRLASAEAAQRGGKATANDASPRVKAASRPDTGGKQDQPILAAHSDADAQRPSAKPAKATDDQCDNLLANPVARSGKSFRKPVNGLIVSKFGSRSDGSFNDGVDFSVPKGTPVKAAENGVVAYVGDELSGFGNLVLVRHADGYVTAYAHNDQVMVKRCEVVKRGQIIAKAGATGKVTKPLLHFELRRNSKAIDPIKQFSRS